MIDPDSVVYAGGVLYALANDEPGVGTTITARNPENGAEVWSARVPEQGQYIAIANGRLFLSTRQGSIYCFAPKGTPAHGKREESADAQPLAGDLNSEACRAAAKAILAPATADALGCGVEGKGRRSESYPNGIHHERHRRWRIRLHYPSSRRPGG